MSRLNGSFYEVATYDVEGLSVVFHCNDGSRAFCAPFQLVAQSESVEIPPPNQLSETPVVARFDVFGDDSRIIIYPDYTGPLSIRLDLSSLSPESVGCDSLDIGIFERPKFSSVFTETSK